MSDDVLSRKPVPPDATISYGSYASQVGDLFLPPSQYLKESGPTTPLTLSRDQRERVEGRQLVTSTPSEIPLSGRSNAPFDTLPLVAAQGERKSEAGPQRPLSPIVIAIHGGFWRAQYDRKHLSHLCRAIARSGFAVWSLEYRRLGESGGGWPGTFDDVAAGAALLKKLADAHKLDLNRVTTIGHSAGGQLALWLATQPAIQIHNVVALAAVSDLAYGSELKLSKSVVDELMGGSPATVPERYRKVSPSELLPLEVKQQLIHGADDEIVPFEMSRRYAEAARHAGDPITLQRLENTGHFEPIDPESAAWPVVLAAIAR